MSTRYTRTMLAAAVVTGAFAGWGSRAAFADHKMPVTAVGCLQGERQYRRQHESSKFAGTGAGLNNEYVLIDAVIGGPDLNIEPVTEEERNCTASQGSGQAFELTGHGEGSLDQFLGRRVALHGMLKHIKHDVGPAGTSGTFTPSPTDGGPSGRIGMDLKLREINVDGASLVPIREIPAPEPLIHYAPEAPAPEPAGEEPVPQTPPPAAPAVPALVAPLPKTASPLPELGLIGLLSLACGIGVHLFARRRAPNA